MTEETLIRDQQNIVLPYGFAHKQVTPSYQHRCSFCDEPIEKGARCWTWVWPILRADYRGPYGGTGNWHDDEELTERRPSLERGYAHANCLIGATDD